MRRKQTTTFVRQWRLALLGCLFWSLPVNGDVDRVAELDLAGLRPLVVDQSSPLSSHSPILMQFWASWCHSCAGIMWDMDELMQAAPNVAYVAVSLDDDPGEARAYIEKHALFDRYKTRYFHDPNKSLSKRLGVDTVPVILVIDTEGRVVVRKTGHLNSTDLQQLKVGLRGNSG